MHLYSAVEVADKAAILPLLLAVYIVDWCKKEPFIASEIELLSKKIPIALVHGRESAFAQNIRRFPAFLIFRGPSRRPFRYYGIRNEVTQFVYTL